MSQYSTGTATVTNGSATATGTNTLWLANVTAGNSFTVAGDGVMYDVASVDSDTQVTLSAPYAGTTASGVVYAIGTGFTVPDSFPEMSQGDIETATIFTRAMRKIQGKFSSILAGGASANFTTMPQVGGDPVVESGSNADGEFTRWADGTQITSNQFLLGENLGNTVNGFYQINQNQKNFSVSFLSTPKLSTSVASNLTNTFYSFVTSDNGGNPATSTNTGRIRGLVPTSTGALGVDVIAYGRWK
jgi:hypothetical protein